ncbi:hypothetical protein V5O48_005831 [Marasmius crinis-equi]|uniref:Uncharacterized protein n=1 Tax=Marasmius crinis-equi TaxID=585013 RepID=A0ABR3FLU7_9AGAR
MTGIVSDTAQFPATPPGLSNSEHNDEPIGLILTPPLRSHYPSLLPSIRDAIVATETGAKFRVSNRLNHPSEVDFEAISWEGHNGRAGVIWMDAADLINRVKSRTLNSFLFAYQRAFKLSMYSDIRLIVYRLSTLPQCDQALFPPIQRSLFRDRSIPAICVESIEGAAQLILDISSDLYDAIEDPENEEEESQNAYARMLLRIPGMNYSRVELVMLCFPSPSNLQAHLSSIKDEFLAKELNLNTTIFTRSRENWFPHCRERWVENIFHAMCHDETIIELESNDDSSGVQDNRVSGVLRKNEY